MQYDASRRRGATLADRSYHRHMARHNRLALFLSDKGVVMRRVHGPGQRSIVSRVPSAIANLALAKERIINHLCSHSIQCSCGLAAIVSGVVSASSAS